MRIIVIVIYIVLASYVIVRVLKKVFSLDLSIGTCLIVARGPERSNIAIVATFYGAKTREQE